MKRNHNIYLSTNNIQNDALSRFLSHYYFEPHEFGPQSSPPEIICNNRIIGDFELIYVTKGRCHIKVDSKEYFCTKGDLLLIPPFVKHSILALDDVPHTNYWLHFDVHPFHLQGSFIDTYLNNHDYLVHINDGTSITELYHHIEKEINCHLPGYHLLIENHLRQIITLVLRQIWVTSMEKILSTAVGSKEDKLIKTCTDIMMSHLDKPMKISDLCIMLHVSEPYLYKLFAATLSLSPNQFYQLLKIKRAEQLMKTTDMTFKEISESLAYSSPYYFSHVFKNHFSVSPRDYMKTFNSL